MNISEFKNNIGKRISGANVALTKIFDYKKGEGEYGPWSMQNGYIKDETGDCKILFKNRDDLSSLEGANLSINAYVGKKGMSGLVIKQSEYEGTVSIVLEVTASAKVTTAGEESEPAETASEPAKNVVDMPKSSPAQKGVSVSDKLAAYSKLYAKCLAEASGVAGLLQDPINEDIRTIATVFFIQGVKEGLLNAKD